MSDLNKLARSISLKHLRKLSNDELTALAVMFSMAICEEMCKLSISTMLSGAYKMQDDTLGAVLFRRVETEPTVVYCAVGHSIISQRSVPLNNNIIEGALWVINPLREDVVLFLSDSDVIIKAFKLHPHINMMTESTQEVVYKKLYKMDLKISSFAVAHRTFDRLQGTLDLIKGMIAHTQHRIKADDCTPRIAWENVNATRCLVRLCGQLEPLHNDLWEPLANDFSDIQHAIVFKLPGRNDNE